MKAEAQGGKSSVSPDFVIVTSADAAMLCISTGTNFKSYKGLTLPRNYLVNISGISSLTGMGMKKPQDAPAACNK